MKKEKFKISLIMNRNSYVGREYLFLLKNNKIKIDVLSIGNYPKQNILEDERCGKLWTPESQENLSEYHNFFHFDSLNSKKILEFLEVMNYDLGIQGGTGIINNKIIRNFRLGILNFHPGKLPKYRGCSAPEWQIYEGEKVFATCHLLDESIDTGDIIDIQELRLPTSDYYKFRSSVYIEISKFMLKIIKKIIDNKGFVKTPYKQDEKNARYLKYIGETKIGLLKKNYFKVI